MWIADLIGGGGGFLKKKIKKMIIKKFLINCFFWKIYILIF